MAVLLLMFWPPKMAEYTSDAPCVSNSVAKIPPWPWNAPGVTGKLGPKPPVRKAFPELLTAIAAA